MTIILKDKKVKLKLVPHVQGSRTPHGECTILRHGR